MTEPSRPRAAPVAFAPARPACSQVPEEILVAELGLRLGRPPQRLRGLLVAQQSQRLFLEVARLALPVLGAPEVREGGREGGVLPAARDPGRVRDEAERAQ